MIFSFLSNYLENRPQLKLLIIVLDSRRDLSEEDKLMISWAQSRQKEVLFVLSKSDKLSAKEKNETLRRLASFPASSLLYSIHEGRCRGQLEQIISSHINT